MSLVVAQIEDDSVTLVSDTKVTWSADPVRTRRTFKNAQPKTLLLNPAVAVGFAGNFDDTLLGKVVAMRDRSVEQILDALSSAAGVTFVVADADRMQLWTVGDGEVEDRTHLRRAWAGSQRAYEVFRQKEFEWPQSLDLGPGFVLTSSMQFLTSFDVVADVGGYTLTAAGGRTAAFTFVPMPQTTFPAMFEGLAFDQGEVVHVRQLAGAGATYGAFGLWLDKLSRGLLFTHEQPWVSVVVDAATVDDFLLTAADQHGQTLTG